MRLRSVALVSGGMVKVRGLLALIPVVTCETLNDPITMEFYSGHIEVQG